MLLAVACGPRKAAETPSAQDFGPYIKAFTGGIVPEDAVIRVELTEDAAALPTEGLFTFKPAVKGIVRWEDAQSVSFLPDEGALRAGLVYQVKFALGQVRPGAPEVFPFGITVKGKEEAASVAEEPDNGQAFRVVSVALEGDCIDVVLNQNPANAQERGMVELKGAARSYVQVEDNHVRVHFERRSGDLTLTVDKGLKNADGDALGTSFVRVFAQEEEKPAVTIPIEGNILPDRQALLLPFRAVNLSAVEVRVVKIYESNILMFLQDNNLGGESSLRRSGRLVYHSDIPLDATKDLHQWNTHVLDLSGLFKQEPGAIYRIRLNFRLDQSLYGGKRTLQALSKPSGKPSAADEATWDIASSYYWDNDFDWSEYNWEEAGDPTKPSYYMDSDRFPSIQLMASDLGLLAEYAGGKQLWVAATDLISAKPVPGASVEVYDYQLQSIGSGKTDAKGLTTLEVTRKPFVVVAKAGGSSAYLKVNEGNQRSTSRFDVGGEVLQQGLKAFLYGERGVWRPGDTLHVTAIVADKGKNLPAGHPATLEVYTPEGQFYSRQVRQGVDGFYSFDVVTGADDPTGYWNAYLKVGGSSFHKTLHVETIKPNRLKIQTGYPAILEAGANATVNVSSRWLSGAVSGNCPVHAQMTLKKAGASPFKGFEKYSFYLPANLFTSSEQELFHGQLDASGNLSTRVSVPAAENAPGMLQAFVVTSVQEPGGDESFTTETIPFSPYSAYVGVCVPDGDFLETDKEHVFRLTVVDAAGNRVKGHKVEYAVYKTGWEWWWDNGGADLDAYVNGSSVERVMGGTTTVGGSDATFGFRVDYPTWGRYMVLARDLQSGHVTGRYFTVDWPEYRGRADRRDPESLTMLSISLDKKSYNVGEKATLYIPAAKGGQALVSIENAGGVLSHEWVTTGAEDTQWSFTVTPEMAPNVYVQVTLLQPYGAAENDLPLRLYGVQRVQVENPDSHLEPQVQLPEVIHPEETFQVKVSEKSGKPMTYTLAIVDEGLLDLTAFQTPDPWSRMYKNEALGVNTWDLYDQVVGAFSGKFTPLAAIGGDQEAVRSARKDNRFNPVVLFLPPRTLGAKGTDVLKLKLPMYVGSVRVMLVAGHDGAYGNAEKTVPVQNPLMVVSTLPRILGSGEEVTAAVNVFAMEKGLGEVKVTLKADGPLAAEATQALRFSDKGDQLVRFPLKASGEEGIAHITVTATGAGHKATETIALEVRNPYPALTTVERITLPKGATQEVKGTSLQLAAFPAVNVQELYLNMKQYPYNCSEQLSARGLTLLHLIPLLDEADAADAKAALPGLISELYSRQKSDGGFAYWSTGSSNSWVSSMAGLFLTEASKAGFEVNAGVLRRWKDYQQKLSQAFRLAGTSVFSQLDEAYRLYTLAVSGNASLSAMNRLKESAGLGEQARWMLSSAYAISGKASLAATLLDGISKEFPEYEPNNITYGSSLRDRLLALDALVLNDRVSDALALAADIPERSFSTQESAFAASAYHHLYEKMGGSSSVHAKVGEKEVAASASVVSLPLQGTTQVQNLSDGALYGTVLSVTRGGTRKALANGIAVDVRYFDEQGAAVDPATLKQGTRFTATVKVTGNAVRSFDNLALSLRIPSGWEIINDRMSGAADDAPYDYKDIRDDRVNWFFGLPSGRSKTFKVQLRAAYEGAFVLPSVVCEAMYDPSVSACTLSGKAVVTR